MRPPPVSGASKGRRAVVGKVDNLSVVSASRRCKVELVFDNLEWYRLIIHFSCSPRPIGYAGKVCPYLFI